ncbi:hypothetical protein WKW80_24185 [Variovorax humicola]|uniref:Dienelactone hydrolase n=1 Tax=Variovorax humicola TaxID=1769758 RepID=A0ABU8W594_9BURK
MRIRQRGLLLALGLFLSINALASQAGFRTISVPGLPADPAPIPVALFYPTQSPERSIAMGPFTVHAAMGGTPDAQVKGLIVLSHGNGGSELGHASLAEALARDGYLVAAIRHPGDNWQDRSLLANGPARPSFAAFPTHGTGPSWTPGMPIPTPDGDIGADPPGFDRPAFLKQLSNEIPAHRAAAYQEDADALEWILDMVRNDTCRSST